MQSDLASKAEKLEKLSAQMETLVAKHATEDGAAAAAKPTRAEPIDFDATDVDLCTADVLGPDSPWTDNLGGLILEMQRQWLAERTRNETSSKVIAVPPPPPSLRARTLCVHPPIQSQIRWHVASVCCYVCGAG